MRREFLITSVLIVLVLVVLSVWNPVFAWTWLFFGPLLILGFQDYFQVRQTIRRNFPLLGRFRYLFETIRPEINQYFVESNTDGVPFNREQRSLVYQRAKNELDTLPFGTQKNVYEVGYEYVSHSLLPTHVEARDLRFKVGGSQCAQPYSASILNISAMSYGSLSKNAVLALNGGARIGGFAHNTGEGGLSPYHLQPGGDLVWEIGTGYFSCRTPDGKFSDEEFQKRAKNPQVKMIELKLSQGAKPGHGGILPAAKVTPEIAEIRGVPMGQDVVSPPAHSAFSNPVEMMQFLHRLRQGSGGKPVGFKMCLGKRREFIALCKAMEKTGLMPDYIVIDGGEGGTGAAPLEFSNHVGAPGIDAQIFVHNALVGFGLREEVRLVVSGKVISGFDIIKRLALGADAVYSARAMMIALGCIQALRCNSNHCPTGVATQDPNLVEGLVVADKEKRVATFHRETLSSVAHLLGAMGLHSPQELRPWHIMRRVDFNRIQHYGEIYEYLEKGALLKEPLPKEFARACRAATYESFHQPGG